MLKKIPALIVALVICHVAAAQTSLEETMYKSGKIYTFLAVAFVVLAGILFYLFRLDIKLGRMERELKGKGNK